MELTIKIFEFILSISILVVLHEFGHFLPAKYFKTRAEKFFMFFDPWFSLFAAKKINGKWKFKILSKNQPDTQTIIENGEEKQVPLDLSTLPDTDWRKHPESTKWGIGWLPMGGYVKIAGMVDESMDTEQLKKPAEPWEFRSKPAWQRLIIMLGGVTVNFFLAWLIYSGLSFFKGEQYVDLQKFQNGISVSEAGKKMGFESGDKLLAIDGKPAQRLENSAINILFSNNVTVDRNGKEISFKPHEDGIAEVIKQREAQLYIAPRMEMVLDSVGTSAQKAGLRAGDQMESINGKPARFFDESNAILATLKNQTAQISVDRNGKQEIFQVPVNAEGKLGVRLKGGDLLKYATTKDYSVGTAIPRGFQRTIDALTMQVKQFKIMFNSKIQGYKNVGGPIAIVSMMPVDKAHDGSVTIDWAAFWSFTAMFSVWLAFLNLIPIPGLDGGHVLFTLWEIITGKPVPQKILENAQMIGVIFLLGLMVLIFGNDIYKIFFPSH